MATAEWIELPDFEDSNGTLTVLHDRGGPFSVVRAFAVTAPAGATRGRHAHRYCSQLLVSLRGTIRVDLNDGHRSTSVKLTRPRQGLLIPPMVWAEQEFLLDESVLFVACDYDYAEDEYIRDWGDFLRLSAKTV